MKFNHTAHKELWDWLSKNPSKAKTSWPGWEQNGGQNEDPEEYACFACYYAEEQETGYDYDDCRGCPLHWTDGLTCDGSGSLYSRWFNEKDLDKCAELARQIRDLPVKEGVECI